MLLKVILILFFPTLFFGQQARAQEANAFADKVQRAYEATTDLSADFVQKTYVAVLEREVAKKGVAKFQKPNRFAIRYAGSRGRQYLSNGKTMWIFEAGDNQSQEISLNEESVPAEALSFLGGLGNLKRDFAVEEVDPKKWASLKREKSELRWLELTPLKKRSTIDWLVMGFDKRNYLVQELYIHTDSGNLSHYVFSKIQPNAGIPAGEFEYKKADKGPVTSDK